MTKHKEAELEAETRSQPAAGVSAAAALVPGLTVLCHPDLERVGERALLTALTSGGEERLSRYEPLFVAPAAGDGAAGGGAAGDDSGAWGPRPLADPFLSRMPIRLLPEGDGGAVRIVCDTSRTSLARGVEPRWFTLPWFDRLREVPELRDQLAARGLRAGGKPAASPGAAAAASPPAAATADRR